MAFEKRHFLTCNGCGVRVECDSRNDDPFSITALPDPATGGWVQVERNRHLCPSCAVAYRALKEEYEQKLRKLTGADYL